MAAKKDGDMKIVSMERTEAEKKVAEARWKEGPGTSGPDFPYGLTLNLGTDELAKLGIKELPAYGDEFHIYAVCCVTRVQGSADKQGENKSIELQITHMGAMHEDEADEKKPTGKSALSKLYPSAEAAEDE